MQSLKQLAGQTAIYGLSSILGRFLNYLLTPILTYAFLPKEYGVVTEMYAFVAFLVVMLTYGMETAFFRYVSKSENPNRVYQTALFPVATTGMIFMTLCLIFSQSLADLIQYPDNPEYISWFAIIVSLDAISSIPLAKLRHENKAFRFAFVNLFSISINVILVLYWVKYCKPAYLQNETNWLIDHTYSDQIGVGYVFIANLVSAITKILLLSPYVLKLRQKLDTALLKKMIFYGLPLLVAGLAGIINESIDRILLKYLLLENNSLDYTMAQVGIYGACYKVSILITLFVQAYRYAAEPFFFNKSTDTDAKEMYALLMKYFVIVCLFIFVALMFNIDLVMWFVGEEYRVGVTVVPILLMANIFLGIYYNLSVWYKLTDKTMIGAYIAVFGASVTLVLNILLIPKLGYEGSAWATLACYSSMAVVSYFLGRKYYHVPYPVLKILVYFAGVLLIYYSLSKIDFEETTGYLVRNTVLLLIAGAFYLLEKPKKLII